MFATRGFGSDNHSGVPDEIWRALQFANSGFAAAYGTDALTQQCDELWRRLFGPETQSYFVFNGTAANVLSLAALMRPHHSVLVSSMSHLHVDECGAPERVWGGKLIPIETPDGKLRVEDLRPHLIRRGDQHHSQVKAVSITQPTEVGTLYSLEELRELANFCQSEGLWLHMDGARLVIAAHRLGLKDFRKLTEGVDVLSFGGTKNALVFGEAVLFLSAKARETARDFAFVRKQLMQLPSKTRFIAAQFLALLDDTTLQGERLAQPNWQVWASQACAMADRLRFGLESVRSVKITQLTQANSVFTIFPRDWLKTLREHSFFYVWDEKTHECRLMCSWSTQASEVDEFLNEVRRLELASSLPSSGGSS
ncbi:MAG TPA: aminotransferase class I/II-fold pyridoxal phosphate-dependent enzyme [Pseudobdellovibrionaceae bacterium]|nr:aminotransferase class I/II-fold pyridoxal phosphate-dependent enzyme [Pseudobdellovibrionaceae bacterium]